MYGVMTADGRRAFILNSGSNTVSVINARDNQLDTPTLLPTGTIPVGTAPVWADFAPTRTELVVRMRETNGSEGLGQPDQYPAVFLGCASHESELRPEPIRWTRLASGRCWRMCRWGKSDGGVRFCRTGRGRTWRTSVTTSPVPPTIPAASAIPPSKGCGTVSVVNLTTNTVTATIPVAGHPTFLAATTGTPTGKIYVTSAETSLMTVLRTDIDTVQTYIDLQGSGRPGPHDGAVEKTVSNARRGIPGWDALLFGDIGGVQERKAFRVRWQLH